MEQLEVQYKNIIEKPDFFHKIDFINYTRYQLSTKAKDWEHEKEVRLLLTDPIVREIPSDYSESAQKEDGSVDYEDLRFYPVIGRDCFSELYLGTNVEREKQDEILKVARWLNPEMKIYKMAIDPDAFRLKALLFCDKN